MISTIPGSVVVLISCLSRFILAAVRKSIICVEPRGTAYHFEAGGASYKYGAILVNPCAASMFPLLNVKHNTPDNRRGVSTMRKSWNVRSLHASCAGQVHDLELTLSSRGRLRETGTLQDAVMIAYEIQDSLSHEFSRLSKSTASGNIVLLRMRIGRQLTPSQPDRTKSCVFKQ